MLQYLIILLDDTSISFCHHQNKRLEKSLMPLNVLKEGIVFGMKENLQIQFVLPEYPLSKEYWQEMMSIDHTIIAPGNVKYDTIAPQDMLIQQADVLVFNDTDSFRQHSFERQKAYVLRIDKKQLFSNVKSIATSLTKVSRLNLVLTDIESFTDSDFEEYGKCLSTLSDSLKEAYLNGIYTQLNILTDRMMLKQMNNCGAGTHSITLAPDGCFYICPAFYQDDCNTPIRNRFNVGTLSEGLNIKNSSLYKIENAPLCRLCDSYHCKRCTWLNFKTTYEVNTPSHEQCVTSHLERNASRRLLAEIRKYIPTFMEDIGIKEIDYLDPFDVKEDL